MDFVPDESAVNTELIEVRSMDLLLRDITKRINHAAAALQGGKWSASACRGCECG